MADVPKGLKAKERHAQKYALRVSVWWVFLRGMLWEGEKELGRKWEGRCVSKRGSARPKREEDEGKWEAFRTTKRGNVCYPKEIFLSHQSLYAM